MRFLFIKAFGKLQFFLPAKLFFQILFTCLFLLVNGGWCAWTSQPCSKTCGLGQQVQTRTCTCPQPQFGGATCVGDAQQTLQCNLVACPSKYWFSLFLLLSHKLANTPFNQNIRSQIIIGYYNDFSFPQN